MNNVTNILFGIIDQEFILSTKVKTSIEFNSSTTKLS